jgi:hypothetical protein
MRQMTAYEYGYNRGVDNGEFDATYSYSYNCVSCHAASDDERAGYTDGYNVGWNAAEPSTQA